MKRKPYRVANWGDAAAMTTVLLTDEEVDALAFVVSELNANRDPYAPTLSIEEEDA